MNALSTEVIVDNFRDTDRLIQELSKAAMSCGKAFVILQNNIFETMDRMNQMANTNAFSNQAAAANQLSGEVAEVEANLTKAAGAAKKNESALDKMLEKMKGLAGQYLTWDNATKVMSLADSMQNTKAELASVNDGLQSNKEMQDMVNASAQNSGTAYGTMAELVTQIGKQGMGGSTQENIAMAQAMMQSFQMMGQSQQEAAGSSQQFLQAMSDGVVQSDELNTMFQNMPGLAQSLSDTMQMPIDQIQALAAEGGLTAQNLQEAMVTAGGTINENFGELPATWEQAGSRIQNTALTAFGPVLEQISQITQTPQFAQMCNAIGVGLQGLAVLASGLIDTLVTGISFVVDNWSVFGPILAGIAGAVVAFMIIQAAANAISALSTIIMGGKALAAGAAAVAQWALNSALLACPLVWIILLLIAAAVAIYTWIQRVGGLKAAWAIAMNFIQTLMGNLMIGILKVASLFMYLKDISEFIFSVIGAVVKAAFLNMFVNGMMTFENIINGVIDLINTLISYLNEIPGVAIQPIQFVAEFGSKNAQKEAQRQADEYEKLQKKAQGINDDYRKRNEAIALKESENHQKTRERESEILKMQEKAMEPKEESEDLLNNSPMDAIKNQEAYNAAESTSDQLNRIEGNTGRTAEAAESTDENMQQVRDMAEREIIDRTVFSEIRVDMGGIQNVVRNLTDLDAISQYLANSLNETMAATAEGVY